MTEKIIFVIFFFSILMGFLNALGVDQCTFGSSFTTNLDYSTKELDHRIDASGCAKPPCILEKGSSITVTLRFKPNNDINDLVNSVYGLLGLAPAPYPGVYGTSTCNNLSFANGTKTGCPLKANEEYSYQNEFKVLENYPETALRVHWALTDQENNLDVICFEVPARIVPSKVAKPN